MGWLAIVPSFAASWGNSPAADHTMERHLVLWSQGSAMMGHNCHLPKDWVSSHYHPTASGRPKVKEQWSTQPFFLSINGSHACTTHIFPPDALCYFPVRSYLPHFCTSPHQTQWYAFLLSYIINVLHIKIMQCCFGLCFYKVSSYGVNKLAVQKSKTLLIKPQ